MSEILLGVAVILLAMIAGVQVAQFYRETQRWWQRLGQRIREVIKWH